MKKIFVALLALVLLSSCSALGLGSSAADPIPQLVSASRAVHDEIGPRFKAYVATDPTLSMITRDQLSKLVDDWRLAIERAEAYLNPAPTPAPVQ